MAVKKYILSFVLFLLSLQAQAQVHVIFDSLSLYVPTEIKTILRTSGTDKNSDLILIYEDKNKYISASHVNEQYSSTCSNSHFLEYVTTDINKYTCGEIETKAFLFTFGKGLVWINPQNNTKYYFFDNKKRHITQVYIPYSKQKTTFFIESSFLNIEQMQQLFIKPDE